MKLVGGTVDIEDNVCKLQLITYTGDPTRSALSGIVPRPETMQ